MARWFCSPAERSDRIIAPPPSRRKDIQALRALAVVAVFGDHLIGWPRGGFLGVDVFFVLSGFLITGLLVREHADTGRISLPAFFVRRVRRLAPAALLVIGVTIAVSSFAFNATRASGVAVDGLWSSLFAANWRFARVGTDYFTADAPVSPLQHFWSLSVEEQFYLVWPVLLLLLLGRTRSLPRAIRRATVPVVLGALTLASFVCALDVTADNPTSAYFSSFTRVWEIGAGALLALATPFLGRLPDRLRPLLGFAGVAGIVVSLGLIDDTFAVPGPWSLAPVAATLLTLLAGTGRSDPDLAVVPCENNRLVALLGSLSYSLYLWHFPVIILLGSLIGSSPGALASAAALALGLAAASFYLVERPVLRSPQSVRRPGSGALWRSWLDDVRPVYARGGLALLAGVAVVVSGAAITHRSPSAPALPPELAQQDAAGSPSEPVDESRGPAVTALQQSIADSLHATAWPTTTPSIDSILAGDTGADTLVESYYRCADIPSTGKSPTDPSCSFGSPDAPHSAFVVGDSMAAFGFPGFGDFAADPASGWRFQNAAKYACPFVDVDVSFDGTEDACTEHKEAVRKAIRAAKPEVVIVSNAYTKVRDRDGKTISQAAWNEATERAARELTDVTGKIVILSPPPSEKDIKECYTPSSSPNDCLSQVTATWVQRAAFDKTLAQGLGGAWIDSRPLFCAFGHCPAVIGDVLVRMDSNHITPGAAHLTSAALIESFQAAGVLAG